MSSNAPSRSLNDRIPGAVPVSSLLHPEAPERAQADISTTSLAVGRQQSPSEQSGYGRPYFDPVRAEPPRSSTTAGDERDELEEQISQPKKFLLKILQQPEAARACGLGERDRRVIDPPPILQLLLEDFDPNSEEDLERLKAPYNLVHCTLHEPSSKDDTNRPGDDVTVIKQQHNPEHDSRRLMGTLVMSPFVGTDVESLESDPMNPKIGVYFIFHDVSCRQNGFYRLVFKLVPVDPSRLDDESRTPVAAEVFSNKFEVFSAKEFPGMKKSSPLAQALKEQGATISVKKGSR